MRRAKLSDLGDGSVNRRDPGTIYKESSHSCHQKEHFATECLTNATEGRSGNGQSPPATEESVIVGNGLYLPG